MGVFLIKHCTASTTLPHPKYYLADQQAEELISWETAGDGVRSCVKESEIKDESSP